MACVQWPESSDSLSGVTTRMEHARNIAIVLALAVIVWLLPGGGDGANLIGQTLTTVFIITIALIFGRLYQQFRGQLTELEDEWRLILYGAAGVIIVTLAASDRLFDSPLGTFAWLALLGLSVSAIVGVYRHSRDWAY